MARWNRLLILFFLSLVAAAVVIGFTLGERGNLWLPEKFVKDSVAALQEAVARPTLAVAGFYADLREMRVMLEENRVLKQGLANYAQLAGELDEVRSENVRLKEMLAYRESEPQMRLALARVIARNPDLWNQTLVINLGSRDGVRPDMAVVTAKGVVGRVESVSNFSANVQLLTDVENGNRMSVVVHSEPRSFGVLEGYDSQTGLLIVNKLRLEDRIAVGQRVMSSGLGGVVPPRLLIGTVERIDVGDAGISQRAYVRPSADFARVEEVFVVLASELAPESPRPPSDAAGDGSPPDAASSEQGEG